MTVLTKVQVGQIRADLQAAFAAVTAKHGVHFNLGTIRFSADTMTGKLTGVVANTTASGVVVADPKAIALAKVGKRILGQSFNDAAKYHSLSLGTVKVVGYNSRARAYPFVVQTTGGKRYKISTLSAQGLVAAGAV
jgi:hypothetical protein